MLSVGFLRSPEKENRIKAPVSGHPGEVEKCLEMAACGKNSRKMTEAVSGIGGRLRELVPLT